MRVCQSQGCLGSFLELKFSNASAGLSEACETRSACRSRIPATTRRSKKTTIALRSYRAMVRIVCLGTNGCQLAVDSCGYFCCVACLQFLPGGLRASEQWPQVPWQKLQRLVPGRELSLPPNTARFCHNATFWRSTIRLGGK